MLEKIFKKSCLALSLLLILSSISLLFITPNNMSIDEKVYDFLECNSLVDSVKNLELKQTTIIYVKNNSGKWVEYQRLHGNENRILVDKERFSDNLIDAFIAIEDERFESHYGVDWKRTFLATGNLFFKYYSSKQGGSTITQQLIKNITDDRDTSGLRKIREIIRALYLETKVDKDTILQAYLNTIALGNGICGVQAAANYYFNKDIEDLSLVECASIAAITKHPTKYDPKNNPNDNKTRRNLVISKMYELGKITKKEYEKAYDKDIKLDLTTIKNDNGGINSYFVDALIDEVIKDLAKKNSCTEEIASTMLYNGGYRIYSTMQPKVQKTMESIYENRAEYFNQTSYISGQKVQSAMTVVDYSGHIVGIVGGVGKKTANRSLNRATQTPQQPGSTMKPIGVYALAIESGKFNYSTLVDDKPVPNYYGLGRSGPRNAGGKYERDIILEYALQKSLNTIPVQLISKIGIEKSYKFLKQDLGCNNLVEADKNRASLALGGCQRGITTTESASAYSIFGNQGSYHKPTTYFTVKNSNDEVVLKNRDNGKQVISKATAGVMNRLLQRVVYGPNGTGSGVGWSCAGMQVFGKTGTTSGSNDLWFVGGSPYYVCSIWCGYDKNETIANNGTTKRVWKAVMSEIHKGLPYKSFAYDDGIVAEKYCKLTGNLAGKKCKSEIGYYLKNAIPEKCDGVHKKKSDKEDNNKNNSSSTSSTSSSTQSSSITSSTSSSSTSTSSTVTSSNDTSTSTSSASSQPDTSSSQDSSSSSSTSSGTTVSQ